MRANTSSGQWVRLYGGKVNHLITGHGKEDSVTGISEIHFACGAKGYFSEWRYDPSKPKCTKCFQKHSPNP